uniref:Fructose-bisphosphate aldolase n=2 Tax=Chromera velia TaxID=505693 RepID=X2D9U4_9ALVE|nr:class I fructose-1,6-bisphosphate aldolase [Chromera velia]|eukprot:Cvel_21581.t1-p1 / transcript=Cvel_21581.t1 / gene=Cvel_21581 / organism=Chromera_velia_CCMP2878 / gene_product=Fructose-bisphosphate aldolase, cytoplasmic isozyme, putative / transcript_product=Fructose-bisphosphate aldolase, cytoplasmic isozyme, putative / location=Cvel_scaffold2037:5142-8313(+) / protein_length=404 / sequence_SO=supercontig / SO=protein_coding / is_pseudo=false
MKLFVAGAALCASALAVEQRDSVLGELSAASEGFVRMPMKMSSRLGHSSDVEKELAGIASKMASKGKGLLAVDESTKTIGKRLAGIGVENTEANRKAYRNLLFTCPGLGDFISGAILYEETLYQSGPNGGKPFVDALKDNGILPGIKVDTGLQPLFGASDGEVWCTGLDGLYERAVQFKNQGAQFAKWRATVQIDPASGMPSDLAIQEVAHGLARYARIMQAARLVPIVEPEILMDGAHNIAVTAHIQEKVLSTVYKALADNNVFLEGTILKPSMTTPGSDCGEEVTAQDIASTTLRTLERCVPCAVPGITFLSGGMSEEEASVNLNIMNQMPRKGPWSVSFSYGRALQQSCLKAWKGKEENIPAAQNALLARARANGQASMGKYVAGSEPSDDTTLFVKGYKY